MWLDLPTTDFEEFYLIYLGVRSLRAVSRASVVLSEDRDNCLVVVKSAPGGSSSSSESTFGGGAF
jgi:hypothetical protein